MVMGVAGSLPCCLLVAFRTLLGVGGGYLLQVVALVDSGPVFFVSTVA